MFLTSIIGPWILSSFQIACRGPKVLFKNDGKAQWFATICMTPLYPIILVMYEAALIEASKTYVVSVNLVEHISAYASKLIHNDVGLESHLQLVLSVILLLLATSETRTITGVERIFQTDSFFFISTEWVIVISTVLSLLSCVKAYLKGISKVQAYQTTKATLLMITFSLASIALRVFSYVLFWTPALGLFNILKHLQGESMPYYVPSSYPDFVDVSKDTFYYGNAPPIPWSKITRWKYSGDQEVSEPPTVTLYTIFSIDEHFFILLAMIGFNVALQLMAKAWLNPSPFKQMNVIDLAIHGLSSCFIPHPMEDWIEQKGTVAMHKQRMVLVLKEMLVSILINFGINLLLLTPLIILGNFNYHCSTIVNAHLETFFQK